MKYLEFLLMILVLLGQGVVVAQQTCNANIPESTPTGDFTLNNDGTVVHNATGLMWKRCAQGQNWDGSNSACTGTATKHIWQQALQSADTEVFAGHADWRLPNIKELLSIVEFRCADPAINETVFPGTLLSFFWSASVPSNNAGAALIINFKDGSHARGVKAFTLTLPVRVVRGGQTFDSFELPDDDEDGVFNPTDLCPNTTLNDPVDDSGCSDAQVDGDGDGFCDMNAPSTGPSSCTGTDNCPVDSNPGQEDADGDGQGDVCDGDDDNDTFPDTTDLCPNTALNEPVDGNGCSDEQVDGDGDGLCNVNAPSTGPSSCTGSDNCPVDSNPGQEDADADGQGDVCDDDDDNDDIPDVVDLCPITAPNDPVDGNGCSDPQVDSDGDGICDPDAPSVGTARNIGHFNKVVFKVLSDISGQIPSALLGEVLDVIILSPLDTPSNLNTRVVRYIEQHIDQQYGLTVNLDASELQLDILDVRYHAKSKIGCFRVPGDAG